MEKEKKQNIKNEKKKKKNKNKKPRQTQPENCNDNVQNKEPNIQKEPTIDPCEDEELLVGYGTNAMIYNNAADSDSSEDEGIEDYKIGGYPPVHIG